MAGLMKTASCIFQLLLSACCLLWCSTTICAQTDTSVCKFPDVASIDGRIIQGLQKKYSDLESRIDNQSAKLLSRMQVKEAKIKRKLNGIDSSKAQQLFT